MAKIAFSDMRISGAKAALIKHVNQIVADYADQGLSLTLRQVYYQFVSRGLCPNNDKEYKKLGDVVSDGRMAGLIDWDAIEDRTRFLRSKAHWDSPADIVRACANQFRVDRWANQDAYVEVWVEKDALVGVIESACAPLDVPFFSCRGYASQTALYEAGERIRRRRLTNGKNVLILHLGDHDPSGIDMTRDIEDRLEVFSRRRVHVKRLALNMDQIERYNPPPNPAKLSDSRCNGYIARFGDESWELDALEPRAMIDLIQGEIKQLIDAEAWDEQQGKERNGRLKLEEVAKKLEDE